MQKLNCDLNPRSASKKDEIISFKCELHENLQHAMNKFVEDHPNWDQYRILQAAIAGFWCRKVFKIGILQDFILEICFQQTLRIK